MNGLTKKFNKFLFYSSYEFQTIGQTVRDWEDSRECKFFFKMRDSRNVFSGFIIYERKCFGNFLGCEEFFFRGEIVGEALNQSVPPKEF